MKRSVRWLALPSLVGCFVLMSGAHAGHDTLVAQRGVPIVVTRMFSGPDGLSHAEDVDMKFSQLIKAAEIQFNRASPAPPSQALRWHNAPRRRYVVTLSGQAEVEVAGDKKIPLDPGHILLAEDLTGKGHTTRALGTEDWISLFIELDEQ